MKNLLMRFLLFTFFFHSNHITVSAQFFNGGADVGDATVNGREWHISSMTEGRPMLTNDNGEPKAVVCASLNTDCTFYIEDGPNDGDGWTADVRWFHIRNVSNSQYLTVTGTSPGSAVVWDTYKTNQSEMWKQQFRLIQTLAVDKYRIRSRLSQSGIDLVLTVEENGEIKVQKPKANLYFKPQQFSFNLALPRPEESYLLTNFPTGQMISNMGETVWRAPVNHIKTSDHSCYWKFKPVAGGNYYYIVNALTGEYLSNNGVTPNQSMAVYGEGALTMNMGPSQAAQWYLTRDGHSFSIQNRLNNGHVSMYDDIDGNFVGQDVPTPQIPLTNISKRRWILTPIPLDADPGVLPDNYTRIFEGMAPYSPCIILGTQFKRGVCERIGLPADEAYFPFIEAALKFRYPAGNLAQQMLQNFDLHNPAHRTEVGFLVRNYILSKIGYLTPPGNLTPLEANVLTHYQSRIEENRQIFADALEDKWAEFEVSFGLNSSNQLQFGSLLDNLDASNFTWPGDYEMSSAQVELLKNYTSACKTFNLRNQHSEMGIKIVLAIEPFAVPGLAPLLNTAIKGLASNVPLEAFKIAPNLTNLTPDKILTAIKTAEQASQKAMQVFMHAAGQAGNVITVVVMASQLIAQEITQAKEVADLKLRVLNKISWAREPVSIYSVLHGTNELEKLRLMSDMDFIFGAPVSDFFQYNINDNTTLNNGSNFQLLCDPRSVYLNESGQVSLDADDFVSSLTVDFCRPVINTFITPNNFDCTSTGFSFLVSLSASDGNNNQSCQVTINVLDKIKPIARCKDATLMLGFSGNNTLSVSSIDDGSTDNCAIGTMSLSQTTFDCSDIGKNIVQLTVTDVNDNNANCTATVTVVDAFPPSFGCRDVTVEVSEGDVFIDPTEVIDYSLLFEACGIASMAVTTNATCRDIGTTQILTLTVSDYAGNTATCTSNVMVTGSIFPNPQCKNTTIFLDENGFASIIPEDIDNGSTDVCGGASITLSKELFDCTDIGINPVELIVHADYGPSANRSCIALVNVANNNAPAAVCKDVVLNLDINGEAHLSAEMVDNGSYDNCMIADMTVSKTHFFCTDPQNNTVTLTVRNSGDQTAVCTANVSLQDQTKPTITCPANQTVSADGDCSGMVGVRTLLSKSDNCATIIMESQSPASTTLLSGHNDVETVTLTADDGNGNTQSCQFTVTLKDVTLPTITCPPPVTVSCAPAVPAVNLAAVTASDNCGAPVKSYLGDVISNQTCANRFTVTRTYRATDGAGNSSTCTQTITVFDNAAPNFTSVPANVTVQCNSIPAPGTATATDGCGGGAVSVVYNGQSISNILCTDRYTITRQWTATDACGNTRTATQRITVQDTQKPVFTAVPANITVQCHNIPAPGTATAADNCDANVEVNYNGETRANGSCPDSYTLTRRWTAADNCGNTRTVTQRITVRDTEKPAFTAVPAPITLECTQPIPAPGTPAATDNCDNQVSIIYLGQNDTYTNCPNNYTLTRTWRAADNCGNWTTAIQTITVQDTQAPQFTSAPPHITIECSDLVPPAGQPTATDACNGYVHIGFLGNSSAAGDCPQEYVITRTWRATDECGNSATATQTITVQDTQAPLFNNAPADLTLACGAALPAVPAVTASDNCDNLTPVTYLGEQNDGPNCPYTVTRSWQVSDDCGNVRTHTQTIAVQGQSVQEPSEDRQAAAAPPPFALRLAPNPATEQVWVRFVLEQATEATLSILDPGGRLMYEQPFAASAGENSVPVQVGELPGGLYLVQLRAGVQRGVEKLVVE